MQRKATHEQILTIAKLQAEKATDSGAIGERSLMVVKSNALIQRSRFSLSLQEQRLVLYVISKIKPDDINFNEYTFTIAEFCKICGLETNTGEYYKEIKEALKKLADKSLWIEREDGTSVLVRWVAKAIINGKNVKEPAERGKIKIKLDDDLMPYLLELKKYYTQYSLINVVGMRSKYGIRLYELLRSYANLRHKTFAIEELRERLGAENYKDFYNFKARVLEPAMEDIRQYADIKTDIVLHKDGRKIKGVEFVITDLRPEPEYINKYTNIERELND